MSWFTEEEICCSTYNDPLGLGPGQTWFSGHREERWTRVVGSVLIRNGKKGREAKPSLGWQWTFPAITSCNSLGNSHHELSGCSISKSSSPAEFSIICRMRCTAHQASNVEQLTVKGMEPCVLHYQQLGCHMARPSEVSVT